MKSSLYQDYDALAYRPHSIGEERGAVNHVKKAKQKTKGLEVVYDPKRHKDFVTGFRKRKQQRRKEANKQLEKKAKKERVEQRAERRQEMKQQLGLPEDYGIQDSDDDQGGEGLPGAATAAPAAATVKQYQQAGFTTTVSIVNFNAGYSSEEDVSEQQPSGEHFDGAELSHQQHAVQQKGQLSQSQTGRQRARSGSDGHRKISAQLSNKQRRGKKRSNGH